LSTKPFIIVAIDGGAAAGKSSSSRALSEQFNLLHSDTGSYFRSLASEMLKRGVNYSDTEAVKKALHSINLKTRITGRRAEMELSGYVAGDEIRSAEVNAAVSHFAAINELRETLKAYERSQAEVAKANGFSGLIMEGRDIGSAIFPDADFRFYLHADPEERSKRRAKEGHLDKVAERDRLDSSRAKDPLACPPGAIAIDSTFLTLPEVVKKLAEIISTKLTAQ
jgi:cytidylate kinase